MMYDPDNNGPVHRVKLKPRYEGVIESADFHAGDTVFRISWPYLLAHPDRYVVAVSGIDIADCSDAQLRGLLNLDYPKNELLELRRWGKMFKILDSLRFPEYRIEPALVSPQ